MLRSSTPSVLAIAASVWAATVAGARQEAFLGDKASVTDGGTPFPASSSGQPKSRSNCASSRCYIGQELDLSSPDHGIWSLASSNQSHQLDLPLTWTEATQGGPLRSEAPIDHKPGIQWWLRNSNGSISIPALLPSQAHLDLFAAGIIDEPSIGLNEGTSRWVHEETWTYTASMEPLFDEIRQYESFILYFQGLDTVTTISLGGHFIGYTANQFREWIFDNVTDILQSIAASYPLAIDRNLTLTFSPATQYALRESAKEPHFPNQHENPGGPATSIYQYPARNFIRKQQSDFGWDWGPAYAPAGPFKPAYLVGFGPRGAEKDQKSGTTSPTGKTSNVFVHGTSIDVYREGSRNNLPPDQNANWIVNVTLDMYAAAELGDNSRLRMRILDTLHDVSSLLSQPISEGHNDGVWAAFVIPSSGPDAPQLWWPSKFGEPKLYTVQVTLEDTDSKETTAWQIRTGFRTVVLTQEPVSESDIAAGWAPGSYCHFEVNGRRIYTHGSNLIPFDTFYPRISLSTLKWHLDSALAAGQNLIRAWGGGIYQSDAFYDMADEMGILIWSETIFSVSLYPTYPAYLANVREEVRQNVRRLNRHPSNCLWAGNNEGEGNLRDVRKTLANASIYEKQYDLLFDKVILDEVRANTKSLSYIPSSTTNGYLQLDPYIPRYLNSTPGEIYGDGEYYGYDIHQVWNTSKYSYETEFRMINEYGFHSMASIYGLDRVLLDDEDYEFNSTVVRAHNRHPSPEGPQYPADAALGQWEMTQAVESYFGLPSPLPTSPSSNDSDRRTVLSTWSYLTNVIQSLYILTQTNHYRFRSSLPSRNLGGIYWQLNDVWAGATSWASMEWGGRWKPLHYAMSQGMARVSVYSMWDVDDETLSIVMASDYSTWETDQLRGDVTATWSDFSGNRVNSTTWPFEMQGITTATVAHGPIADFLPGEVDPRRVWLHLEAQYELQSKSPVSEPQKRTGRAEATFLIPNSLADHETQVITSSLGAEEDVLHLRRLCVSSSPSSSSSSPSSSSSSSSSSFSFSSPSPSSDSNCSDLDSGTDKTTVPFVVSLDASSSAAVGWVVLEHPEGVLGYFSDGDNVPFDTSSESCKDEGKSRLKPVGLFFLCPGQTRRVDFVLQHEVERAQGIDLDGFKVRGLLLG